MYDQSNTIFALDIGTRTVMGLVITDEEHPQALGVAMVEHSSRAMEDGQIHDVEAVASAVIKIRESLSEQVGFPLETAAVAAAGRSLRTETAEVTKDILTWGELSREDVAAIELEAVQLAQQTIIKNQPAGGVNTRYHCVGYSVNKYLLDESTIKNLVGHRGNQAVCSVTATFLPEVVIHALYTVLRKADLRVRSMTLEPIAASALVIPPDLRLLNLALVDMGAGTSDIAISRNGMITAYGMVPVAGDEVSETLEELYLLDFATAEEVKRELAVSTDILFQDVLGQENQLPVAEILEAIKPTIEGISQKIAQEIIALNGGVPPKAVLLVGGASQTPLLKEVLASQLSLAPNRVAIKCGEDVYKVLRGDLSELSGPDGITPIGIALNARNKSMLSFRTIEVVVGNTPVRLFNLVAPTVGDVLLAANIDPSIVKNRLGLAATAKVNGIFQVVKGTPGKPGAYQLNGNKVSLDTPVKDGDHLEVIPAIDGEDAVATVKDFIPEIKATTVTFNGQTVTLRPEILLNGQSATSRTKVPDSADLTYNENITGRDLIRIFGGTLPQTGHISVLANGKERRIHRNVHEIWVNGKPSHLDRRLSDGDEIEVRSSQQKTTLRDVLTSEEVANITASHCITVTVNGQKLVLPGSTGRVLLNGREANLDESVTDGDEIQIQSGRKEAHFFAEVFNYVPVDLGERPEGTNLVTLRNGEPAEYSTILSDGDELVIQWEKDKGY